MGDWRIWSASWNCGGGNSRATPVFCIRHWSGRPSSGCWKVTKPCLTLQNAALLAPAASGGVQRGFSNSCNVVGDCDCAVQSVVEALHSVFYYKQRLKMWSLSNRRAFAGGHKITHQI